jgi:hypothetical protein
MEESTGGFKREENEKRRKDATKCGKVYDIFK